MLTNVVLIVWNAADQGEWTVSVESAEGPGSRYLLHHFGPPVGRSLAAHFTHRDLASAWAQRWLDDRGIDGEVRA